MAKRESPASPFFTPNLKVGPVPIPERWVPHIFNGTPGLDDETLDRIAVPDEPGLSVEVSVTRDEGDGVYLMCAAVYDETGRTLDDSGSDGAPSALDLHLEDGRVLRVGFDYPYIPEDDDGDEEDDDLGELFGRLTSMLENVESGGELPAGVKRILEESGRVPVVTLEGLLASGQEGRIFELLENAEPERQPLIAQMLCDLTDRTSIARTLPTGESEQRLLSFFACPILLCTPEFEPIPTDLPDPSEFQRLLQESEIVREHAALVVAPHFYRFTDLAERPSALYRTLRTLRDLPDLVGGWIDLPATPGAASSIHRLRFLLGVLLAGAEDTAHFFGERPLDQADTLFRQWVNLSEATSNLIAKSVGLTHTSVYMAEKLHKALNTGHFEHRAALLRFSAERALHGANDREVTATVAFHGANGRAEEVRFTYASDAGDFLNGFTWKIHAFDDPSILNEHFDKILTDAGIPNIDHVPGLHPADS
jgi:hypothetical protein